MDRSADGRMQAQTALVRTDRGAVTGRGKPRLTCTFSLVVHPGNTELDDTFRFYQTTQQILVCILRIFFNEGPQAFHDFRDCLMEFRLVGIALSDAFQKLFKTLFH